jgi:NitT/TauT family transport system permease protein
VNVKADENTITSGQSSSSDSLGPVTRAREQLARMANTPAGNLVRRYYEYLIMPVIFLAVFGLWKLVIQIGEYPPFVLPSPELVWKKFLIVLKDGSLWNHARYTLFESILGFLLALVFGTTLGYLLAKSKALEKLVSPYIVASRGVPVIAIAPLLVIWFGFGLPSKVFVSFFIVFFPMLINTIVGIRGVDADQRELMRSYEASHWQVFRMLEVPSALPVLLGGIKVGITGSIMGAVVGEFVGSDRGLGFLVNLSKGVYDTPLMFVAIGSLAVMSFILYSGVWGLEIIVLRGRRGSLSE